MKNLLKNYDRLDSFGYWSLTDLLEEVALPDTLFHGGLGIYTMNGLRKNVFYAFYFANMLGDELIAADDGYFITRKNDSYQIITYHYVHYGNLFASGELFDITETNRYTPFDMSGKLRITLGLTDLPQGSYELREYFVNREKGSAFDIWLQLGGVPLDPHDTDLFRGLCVPGYHKDYFLLDKGDYTYSALLEPLEIRFAQIKRISSH
jgi:xylan 1,4-beta-xylosidase